MQTEDSGIKFITHAFNINDQIIRFSDVEGSTAVPTIVNEIVRGSYGLLRNKLIPGDVVVDVGAHVGVFSIIAALLYPGIKIYAFEPMPLNYMYLVKNVRTAGLWKR